MAGATSIYTLHRLLPSDLEKMKREVSRSSGAYAILSVFAHYLSTVGASAVELDDVTRIALQLNSVGLWDAIRPEFFLKNVRDFMHYEVLKALRAALNVDPKMENTITPNDRPVSMQEIVNGLASADETNRDPARRPKKPFKPKPVFHVLKAKTKRIKGSRLGEGQVMWFKKEQGVGFIKPVSGGKEVLVRSSAVERAGIDKLKKGQTVEYKVVSKGGQKEADDLKLK